MKRDQYKKRKTIVQTLVPAIFLGTIIAFGLFAITSQVALRQSMRTNLDAQISSELDKGNDCLNMVLDKYGTVLYDLSTDDEVIELLANLNKNDHDYEVYKSSLIRKLQHICNRNTYIYGVTIELQNGRIIYYDGLQDSSIRSDWAESMLKEKPKNEVEYFYHNVPINVGDQTYYMFQVERKLVDYHDIGTQLGDVSLNVSVEELGAAVQGSGGSQSYLCTEDGIVLGSANEKSIGKKLKQFDSYIYRTTKKKNQTSGFTIVNVYNLSSYRSALNNQVFFWLYMAVISIVLLLFVLYYFTQPIIMAFQTLESGMQQMVHGNLYARLPIRENDSREVAEINHGFNSMAEQLDEMMGQVKQAVLEQKNAEISALEAQIDPHFLYNTLDTINWKALEKEDYEISEMVTDLADILRYSVKNAAEEVSIAQEVSWLRKYVSLQQEKLGRIVELRLDIQPEAEICRFHKLLLQPFVENAIKYSFPGKEGHCVIKLRVHKIEDQVHIQIEDNGVGIAADEIKRLNDEQEDFGNHLGVTNVRKRLKLYYENDASMYFESQEGEYLRIHLFIPYVTKE